MNFVECSVSELDLWSESKLQTGVLGRSEIAHHPVNSLDQASSVEFFSAGQASYKDLSHVFLQIKVQLTKNGSDPFNSASKDDAIKLTDAIEKQNGIINNQLHSLFKSIQVYMNNKLVSNHNLYPYKAYFELITNYSKPAMDTYLATSGVALDSEKLMDNTKNPAHIARAATTLDGTILTLYGRISADLFNLEKLLLPSIDLRVNFTLASPSFSLFGPDENSKGTIKIKEATLYITHVAVNPSLSLLHHQMLSKRNVNIPFMKTDLKNITVAAGLQTIVLDNIFTGRLPTFLMIALVENASFAGRYDKNPFNFARFNIKSLQLIKNQQLIPPEPLEFSDLSRPYIHLLDSLDAFHTQKHLTITKSMYESGYFINAWNLSGLSQLADCVSLQIEGSIRLHIQFKTALESAITVIMYSMVPDMLQIDRNFNVSTRSNTV